jgi:hypothetical protein
MATTPSPLPSTDSRPGEGSREGSWQTPPWTLEEHLQRIQALGQQITGHVQFMCAVGTLSGTSVEAKEKAVAAFYARLGVLERQLGRIREDLQLG